MNDGFQFFVGIDWASEEHEVCVIDPGGAKVGARAFKHSGDGLADLSSWLCSKGDPATIAIAIEVPHGAVVETLLERGFAVFSIVAGGPNPTLFGAGIWRRVLALLVGGVAWRHIEAEAGEDLSDPEYSLSARLIA